jgi:hypothetical protein
MSLVSGAASATVPAGNLVVNGGAEVGPSSEVGDRHPIVGWSTTAGAAGFMSVDYRAAGDPNPLRMDVEDPNTAGCRAFFGGGEGVNTATSASQLVDVSAAASEIDGGSVTFKAAGAIGQVPGGEDTLGVSFEFLNGSGSTIGFLSVTSSSSATTLNPFSASLLVLTAGTRQVRVKLTATAAGPANTAYADSIAFTLDGSDPAASSVPAGCNGGTALTGGANGIATTAANVTGLVMPNLDFTRYRFEYGPTTAYGSASAAGTTDGGSAQVPVSATLTGLTPGTLYHYRLVAESPRPLGTGSLYANPSIGADQTFRTADAPSTAGPLKTTRSLSIRYSAKRKRFRGRIRSSSTACLGGKVKVFRVQKGRDPKVASDRADASGKWAASEDAGDGRYYASIGKRTAGAISCPAAKSATVKVN